MPSHRTIVGWAAACIAAMVGAGWQLASRHAVTTSLAPWDVALLRYSVPALLLVPLWPGALPLLARLGAWRVCLLLAGGLPFGLLVLAGARFAPAAHIAVFMAGTMPLFTAAAAAALQAERMTPLRLAGFSAILLGLFCMGFAASAPAGAWRGDLLFLLAAAAWTAHTLAFRRSGLSPWQGAAVCSGASACALAVAAPWIGVRGLLDAPVNDVIAQLVWQGVIAGLLGIVAYLAAVERLGSSRAALSGAFVPLFTAVGAAAFLGERLSASGTVAIALVAVGVALASGAFERRAVVVA